MIQRVQSLWLLLAAVCTGLTLKLPFYSGLYLKDNTTKLLTGSENFLLGAVTFMLAGLAVITIFLFKDRKLQLRLCIAGILLDIILLLLYFRETKDFGTGTFSLTSILHAGILTGFFLAARGISKDEKMIRESDRLR
jgi:Domain of unknown function (DUF4293)